MWLIIKVLSSRNDTVNMPTMYTYIYTHFHRDRRSNVCYRPIPFCYTIPHRIQNLLLAYLGKNFPCVWLAVLSRSLALLKCSFAKDWVHNPKRCFGIINLTGKRCYSTIPQVQIKFQVFCITDHKRR